MKAKEFKLVFGLFCLLFRISDISTSITCDYKYPFGLGWSDGYSYATAFDLDI